MENPMLDQLPSFEQIRNIATEFSCIESSCMFAHITEDMDINKSINSFPRVKVEGSVLILMLKGRIDVDVDTSHFVVDSPSFFVLHHGSMVQLSCTQNEPVDVYVLVYTPSFLHDVNISLSSISGEALIGNEEPIMRLREREVPHLLRFFNLIHSVMLDQFNLQMNRHIVSSLTSALFYQLMLQLYKRIDMRNSETFGPRRSSYVQDFMRLVHVYYTRERSVSFYASKLFISPKYLSLLVKEATGRSAARWIDHFVITEAKNLLRFSGKNVQQVAYALNFSNQSSFGKYFKHLTGLSPTEYQKV